MDDPSLSHTVPEVAHSKGATTTHVELRTSQHPRQGSSVAEMKAKEYDESEEGQSLGSGPSQNGGVTSLTSPEPDRHLRHTEEGNEESSSSSNSRIDPEHELLEYWNNSLIVSTLANSFPERHVYEDAATPTFFPSARHHRFFPEMEALELTKEEEMMQEDERQRVSDKEEQDIVSASASTADGVMEKEKDANAEGMTSALKSTTPKGTAESPRNSRIRVEDFVAYPPEDAKTTKQYNLLFWEKLPLYSIFDVPHWQAYNPAIRGSYRAFYDTGMTFKSFFGWHNETVNVWTHFIGFVLFLCLTVFIAKEVFLPESAVPPHLGNATIFYYVFYFGCMGCTMCSAVYHLFTGHRDCHIMTLMGRIDFIGITMLIIGSFLPPLYVLMHCFPVIRQVYLSIAVTLGIFTSIACWTNAFFEHAGLRVGLFVSLAVSGVAPLIHIIFLVPFSAVLCSITYGVALMLVLYGVGVVFYVSKFPEAWFPAHFDCFLSSHQLWHYFVLLAAMVHFFNCTSMYQMYTMSKGNC